MLRPGLILLILPVAAAADPPTVEQATALESGGRWTISVTLSHPDTGWDHYADGWRVLDEDGNELGLRTLYHPHVSEQPFTRSLSGLAIPDRAGAIFVEPRCNIDGWSGRRTPVDIPK